MKHKLYPSILSIPSSQWKDVIPYYTQTGITGWHVDMMDGIFVENYAFSLQDIAGLRQMTSLPLDVHLMVKKPGAYIDTLLSLGIDRISFHAEIRPEPNLFYRIKQAGKKAGVAIDIHTPLSAIQPYLERADFILVMCVKAGAGGQGFDGRCLEKIEAIHQAYPTLPIEVDGGINQYTIKEVLSVGATEIVAGASIFGAEDPKDMIRTLLSA